MATYPGSTSRDYKFVTGSAASAADASAQGSLVHIAAAAGQHHCIQRCDFSYSADVTMGELTIGLATTVKSIDSGDSSLVTVADATGFTATTAAADILVIQPDSKIPLTGEVLSSVNQTTNVLDFAGAISELAIGDVLIKVEYMLYVTGGGAGPLVGNDAPLFTGNKGADVGIWLKQISNTASRLNVLYY